MKKITYLLICFLAWSTHSYSADDCAKTFKDHFGTSSSEWADRYFKIQSKITLHRLAILHLTVLKRDGITVDEEYASVQKTLGQLLNQKSEASQASEFIEAEKRFQNAPFSRTTLEVVLPALKSAIEAQTELGLDLNETDRFTTEDIKMTSVLAELEAQSADPNKERFTANHARTTSILNLLKLVNSGYQGHTGKQLEGDLKEARSALELALDSLDQMKKKWQSFLSENAACLPTIIVCDDCSETPTPPQPDALVLELFNSDFKNRGYQSVRYGDVWLHVSSMKPADIIKTERRTLTTNHVRPPESKPAAITTQVIPKKFEPVRWTQDTQQKKGAVAVKNRNKLPLVITSLNLAGKCESWVKSVGAAKIKAVAPYIVGDLMVEGDIETSGMPSSASKMISSCSSKSSKETIKWAQKWATRISEIDQPSGADAWLRKCGVQTGVRLSNGKVISKMAIREEARYYNTRQIAEAFRGKCSLQNTFIEKVEQRDIFAAYLKSSS